MRSLDTTRRVHEQFIQKMMGIKNGARLTTFVVSNRYQFGQHVVESLPASGSASFQNPDGTFIFTLGPDDWSNF